MNSAVQPIEPTQRLLRISMEMATWIWSLAMIDPTPNGSTTNDGNAQFELVDTFGDSTWPTRNVTVADLNGDQRPEIIVANRGGPDNKSTNSICFNNGAGGFDTCTVLSSQSATTIAAGDVDGDGSIDLVVPHRDGGQS